MVETKYEYDTLSTREGFNKALKHFKSTMAIISDFENYANLADILNDLIAQDRMRQNQIPPVINALLIDKYAYAFESFNLEQRVVDFQKVQHEISTWKAVDLVVIYHHPELGVMAINPKNMDHWMAVQNMNKHELVTVFAGAFHLTKADKMYVDVIRLFKDLLYGKKVTAPQTFKKLVFKPVAKASATKAEVPAKTDGSVSKKSVKPKKGTELKTAITVDTSVPVASVAKGTEAAHPQEAAAPSAAGTMSKNLTPFYGVPVTNELFHNGNVEAWKRIIDSYKAKNPGVEVYIYYDGEAIHDINTLFKWGKVKHGSTILFRVGGENIKDIAKLRRYLQQGASHRFEDFLRFPVNKVLDLF